MGHSPIFRLIYGEYYVEYCQSHKIFVMDLNNIMVESPIIHVITIHLKARDHKKNSLSSFHSDEFQNAHNFMVMVQDTWLGVGE